MVNTHMNRCNLQPDIVCIKGCVSMIQWYTPINQLLPEKSTKDCNHQRTKFVNEIPIYQSFKTRGYSIFYTVIVRPLCVSKNSTSSHSTAVRIYIMLHLNPHHELIYSKLSVTCIYTQCARADNKKKTHSNLFG